MIQNPEIKKLLIKLLICLISLLLIIAVCTLIGPSRTTDSDVLFKFRLPRIILAALVGAALACAGVTLQAILRNPLADPFILGISSGAALAITIATVCGITMSFWFGSARSCFAFAGAIGTVWLVWFIGHFGAGGSSVTSLLLAGVVINAFFSAIIMFFTSIASSSQVRDIALWLMGNITDKSTEILFLSGTFIIIGIIVLISIAAKLNVLSLGQAEAKALGVDTARTKLIAFAAAAFITAIAVSLTGLIGFVGLIVPHGVRLICGPDHRQLIPICALTGAAFLAIADTIARSAFAGFELPVGVITALIGGPFFLILLAKHSRKVSWAK
jgi:iron complex transport system permease protein